MLVNIMINDVNKDVDNGEKETYPVTIFKNILSLRL